MNQSKKKSKLIIISAAVLLVITGGIVYFNLWCSNREISQKTNHALWSVLYTDFYQRLLDGGVYTTPSPKAPKTKIKVYRTMTSKGDTTYVFKDSIDIDTARFRVKQHYMAYYNSIRPDKINALFQDELDKNGIEGKTGIVYIHNGKTAYSNNDSISPSKATYCTLPQYIDYPPSIQIQAWVDYGMSSVWKYLNTGLSALTALCLICIAVLGAWFWILRKEEKKKPNPDNRIICDEATQTCTIEGITYSLVLQDFKLLLMFLQAENHFLSREQIKQAFWKGSNDKSADSNLNTHIKRLRQILSHHQGYKLVTYKGKGYSLIIPGC